MIAYKVSPCKAIWYNQAMPKRSTSYVCQQCGYVSPGFLGKCPECGTWGSLVEEVYELKGKRPFGGPESKRRQKKTEIIKLSDIEKEDLDRLSSNISEFDRVLGGGIVRGSVVLLSGDPGIGKSTLLTQLAIYAMRISGIGNRKNNTDNPVLYVAGEESPTQIKIRVERIKKDASLDILNEVDVDVMASVIEEYKPRLVIVDSVQTLETQDLESPPGSVGQVRECAHRLSRVAKSLHIPIILVGHVTKEGNIAGPKVLEHLVDVVLTLEGDISSQYRIVRATKNRFGSVDEVGIFDMTEEGLVEIKNPSGIFLDSASFKTPGSSITAILTGLRPILLEIQALVTKTQLPIPRRIGIGIDNNRLQLLVAVLTKRLNLPLFDKDVYVNATGGIRVYDSASDLAVCLSIISSLNNKTVKNKTVLIGEVGLLGELRQIRQLEKRISEAKKMGFTNIVSVNDAKNLKDAILLSF